jgi:hypothetical protein
MNSDERLAEFARLQRENEALKATVAKQATELAGTVSCKVSPKGAVQVNGFGRWPVTLYASQWDRVFANADKIKGFIATHSKDLAVKGATAPKDGFEVAERGEPEADPNAKISE